LSMRLRSWVYLLFRSTLLEFREVRLRVQPCFLQKDNFQSRVFFCTLKKNLTTNP